MARLKKLRASRKGWLPVVVLGAVMLAAVAGVSSAALPQQRYRVTFSPRIGGPHTTFVASFIAPYAADGRDTDYYIESFGPPQCADASHFSLNVTKGQLLKMRLRSGDVDLPSSVAAKWCRGSYIVNLVYQTPPGQHNILLGNWRFRVR